ncbi:gamma-glutamyl-gamma-aminobutyrate hydrolase family protein [Enterococcus saccharolyticus]|uniref:Gamma-glutamyl-gamma-aminobutyrate hydrolase n=1 Tax=Candidatus Enterococcus willemsii TaxID=1857215 RepID=A0ABQ6YY91_9ENTE|nr:MULTISPECIES: gamma-glutamyl-gamma-aminobutyrate hydrolase family protein [Enterococcus]KAF1303050.1 gamma-glutamyl-gamma-aminobutyrate hydrolase [Enterococcus sp. CU12B]MCD5001601.1 gamma-glutamyl-gamma-aminobutyrate hydrolase family protein [Enterococcus saccharolyticus]
MGRVVVGIAANEALDAGETLHHLAISYTPNGYVQGVQQAGGLPMVIPMDSPELAKEYISRVDKLILAGGQDVSPRYYKQKQIVQGSYYDKRDKFELALMDEALKQGKPIFAVCRGMQLMNVFFGGNLKQELHTFTDVVHMQDPIPKEHPSHALWTTESSVLRPIYGEKDQVNSFHNQGVHQLASDFQVGATCSDGLVEAIENAERRLLGVQWHPDFAFMAQPKEMKVFDYVVNTL